MSAGVVWVEGVALGTLLSLLHTTKQVGAVINAEASQAKQQKN